MKNKIALLSILSLMFVLVMSSCSKKEEPKVEPAKDTTVTQQTDQATPPEEAVPEGWTKLEAPIVGKVACLTDIAFKGTSKLTLDEAKMCASKGNPFGVLVGEVFYFVYNQDGSPADKMLAELADKESIEISGFTKTMGTMNFLMAKEIKPGISATAEQPKAEDAKKGN
jgi:hypothetical protein